MMVSNTELRDMAKLALENWIFDSETDPDGGTQIALKWLASDGDFDQEIIDSNLSSTNDWDGLQDWAETLGHGIT